MKRIFSISFLVFCFAHLHLNAQANADGLREIPAGSYVSAAKAINRDKDFGNVLVRKLFSDCKASGFVIWIKKEVALHRHDFHSETVYILEGKGEMQLGEANFPIKKGQIIFIPEGTAHSVKVTKGILKVLSIQAPEFDGSDRVQLPISDAPKP